MGCRKKQEMAGWHWDVHTNRWVGRQAGWLADRHIQAVKLAHTNNEKNISERVRVCVCCSLPEHIEVGVQSDTVEMRRRGVSARAFISWHQPGANTSQNHTLLYNNLLLFMKCFLKTVEFFWHYFSQHIAEIITINYFSLSHNPKVLKFGPWTQAQVKDSCH